MPYAVSTFVPPPPAPAGPLVVPLEGAALTGADERRLRHVAVGGVILFAHNYKNRAQLRDLTDSVRSVSPHCLITVDHEGGRVQRFVDGFTPLPPPARLGDAYADDRARALRLAKAYGLIIADELKAHGVDLSFTPVLDLGVNRSVIGDRAFHTDPDIVYALGRALTDGLHARGMQSVGKHFPGHGSVAGDTHETTARDARAVADIMAADAAPFRRLIADGALDAVMSAHVAYGDEAVPATFSAYWLRDVLRGQWGFGGLVFSDDLTMRASLAVGGAADTARLALEAGCDMALVCRGFEVVDALLDGWSETEMARYTDRLARRWRGFAGAEKEIMPYDKEALLTELEQL